MLRQDYESSRNIKTSVDEEATRKPFLPVLIIPGFMSSGLEIKESSLKKSWEGKRLWINLGSLGFHSLHFGGAQKNKPEEESDVEQNKQYKSLWIQHITLLDDMQTEHPGVKVRAIDGLEGVDYLSPGALTSMLSYVFGPVIKALLKVGYEEGKNLDAAPYDWRLAPSTMEERDGYFSRTMKQIERMYKANGNMAVVLMCHSLGCKTGHYFLNFAKRKAGQEWVDTHIHTYMPVGGPHLGAPKGLRSAVAGDKMGLETFLKDEEALIFGRSLGSGPWLIPSALPVGATATALVRKQGSLVVELIGRVSVEELLEGRQANHRPNKVKLMVKFGDKSLSSAFVTLDASSRVAFSEKFVFATDASRPVVESKNAGSGQLLIFLCEPGIAAARVDENDDKTHYEYSWICTCCLNFFKMLSCYCVWCLCFKFAMFIGIGLAMGTIKSADALAKASGGSSVLCLSKDTPAPKEGTSEIDVELYHRNDAEKLAGSRMTKCRIKITWAAWKDTPPEPAISTCGGSTTSVCVKNNKAATINATNRNEDDYVDISGKELFQREQLIRIPQAVATMYDRDELGPRGHSSNDAPPVHRVRAIYGVNRPTEVGAIYRRHRGLVETGNAVKNYYKPDTSAKLLAKSSADGYVCSGGILFETKKTVYDVKCGDKIIQKHISGDGTVPYWSLQHSRNWETDDCKVTVDEIDGADHREILADVRFHEVVLDYITTKKTNDQNV